jgi:hypothetical protein
MRSKRMTAPTFVPCATVIGLRFVGRLVKSTPTKA